jgi:DNA-binding MarR family transcriptional regulator
MTDEPQRRLTLLYQVWLLSQSSSRFMRDALAGTGMRGEEYGLYSYLFANGPRTLSQAARDLNQPLTTLATLLGPCIESGEIVRRSHPRDRRAKLLELSAAGRTRLEAVIPVYTVAYRTLLQVLDAGGADTEAMFEVIGDLRAAIDRTSDLIELETAAARAPSSAGAAHRDPGT